MRHVFREKISGQFVFQNTLVQNHLNCHPAYLSARESRTVDSLRTNTNGQLSNEDCKCAHRILKPSLRVNLFAKNRGPYSGGGGGGKIILTAEYPIVDTHSATRTLRANSESWSLGLTGDGAFGTPLPLLGLSASDAEDLRSPIKTWQPTGQTAGPNASSTARSLETAQVAQGRGFGGRNRPWPSLKDLSQRSPGVIPDKNMENRNQDGRTGNRTRVLPNATPRSVREACLVAWSSFVSSLCCGVRTGTDDVGGSFQVAAGAEYGTAVAERLARSPPTPANRAQSPADSPDFRKWQSCPPPPNSGAAPYSLKSPSLARNTSLLRVAQISSLTLIQREDLRVGRPSTWIVNDESSPRAVADVNTGDTELLLIHRYELSDMRTTCHSRCPLKIYAVTCRLDSTILSTAERQMFVYWLLPLCHCTPGSMGFTSCSLASLLLAQSSLGPMGKIREFNDLYRLHSTAMCILEYQMFVDWLLPQRVAIVTSLLAVKRVRFPPGSLPDFHTWESYRTMPLVGGFSPAYFIPALLHTNLAPPSSALKSLMFRATQILSHSLPLQFKRDTSAFSRRNIALELRAEKTGDPRENQPNSSIVRHDSLLQNAVEVLMLTKPLSNVGAALRFITLRLTEGAAVAEPLARSPPTKANRAQSPAVSPDFRKRVSCRTMPLARQTRGSLNEQNVLGSDVGAIYRSIEQRKQKGARLNAAKVSGERLRALGSCEISTTGRTTRPYGRSRSRQWQVLGSTVFATQFRLCIPTYSETQRSPGCVEPTEVQLDSADVCMHKYADINCTLVPAVTVKHDDWASVLQEVSNTVRRNILKVELQQSFRKDGSNREWTLPGQLHSRLWTAARVDTRAWDGRGYVSTGGESEKCRGKTELKTRYMASNAEKPGHKDRGGKKTMEALNRLASEEIWGAINSDVFRAEGGDWKDPPTNSIVWHDSQMRKYVDPAGIEPGSPWWEARELTARPPRPLNVKLWNYSPSINTIFNGRMSLSAPVKMHAGRGKTLSSRKATWILHLVFEAEKCGIDKGEIATHVKGVIASRCKTLDWHVVLSLCCVEVLRADEGEVNRVRKQRRNGRAGRNGRDPEKTRRPEASSAHDSRVRKFVSDSTGD
ncbi:hypothetical protein PR048_019021 [Dryococelus australis]|uniref:Uncharacterized protein n=1 Tax=Dryococelus australis TaxID=614101 RepID=A0ABQ9H2B7_9NEOP|nr:hypothetical protein PR048_019021 [Dryococelus australis]